MLKFEYIVRRNDGSHRPVIEQGTTEGFRTAVAVKRAGEAIPDRPKIGDWFHVSLRRIA